METKIKYNINWYKSKEETIQREKVRKPKSYKSGAGESEKTKKL